MERSTNPNERVIELLVDRVTDGLNLGQQRELDELTANMSEMTLIDDLTAIDLAAGFSELAYVQEHYQPLPDSLRQKLIEQGTGPVSSLLTANARTAPVELADDDEETDHRFVIGPQRLGWLAAAAMFVIATVGWWQNLFPGKDTPLTLGQRRAALIQEASDVQISKWNKPKAERFANATGDVVWSESRQSGFMRLKGMPKNDPKVRQYQLWIVDPKRDKHPVDGGVFDVAENGEVIIPIDAKLSVKPTVFAITEEKPGGVVVSAGPLLLVATLGQ